MVTRHPIQRRGRSNRISGNGNSRSARDPTGKTIPAGCLAARRVQMKIDAALRVSGVSSAIQSDSGRRTIAARVRSVSVQIFLPVRARRRTRG